MCGIVGAVGRQGVVPILMEGLQRLEYRGYDSAGIAVINRRLRRMRAVSWVSDMRRKLCLCSCLPTASPCSAAPKWASRTTWPNP